MCKMCLEEYMQKHGEPPRMMEWKSPWMIKSEQGGSSSRGVALCPLNKDVTGAISSLTCSWSSS